MKLIVTAYLPDELGGEFLQHIRGFDTAHRGCHFEIGGECPGLTCEQVLEMFKVNPGFSFTAVIKEH